MVSPVEIFHLLLRKEPIWDTYAQRTRMTWWKCRCADCDAFSNVRNVVIARDEVAMLFVSSVFASLAPQVPSHVCVCGVNLKIYLHAFTYISRNMQSTSFSISVATSISIASLTPKSSRLVLYIIIIYIYACVFVWLCKTLPVLLVTAIKTAQHIRHLISCDFLGTKKSTPFISHGSLNTLHQDLGTEPEWLPPHLIQI